MVKCQYPSFHVLYYSCPLTAPGIIRMEPEGRMQLDSGLFTTKHRWGAIFLHQQETIDVVHLNWQTWPSSLYRSKAGWGYATDFGGTDDSFKAEKGIASFVRRRKLKRFQTFNRKIRLFITRFRLLNLLQLHLATVNVRIIKSSNCQQMGQSLRIHWVQVITNNLEHSSHLIARLSILYYILTSIFCSAKSVQPIFSARTWRKWRAIMLTSS